MVSFLSVRSGSIHLRRMLLSDSDLNGHFLVASGRVVGNPEFCLLPWRSDVKWIWGSVLLPAPRKSESTAVDSRSKNNEPTALFYTYYIGLGINAYCNYLGSDTSLLAPKVYTYSLLST